MSNGSILLYRSPISGHSHRVELFLSLLGRPYTLVDVDLMKAEHKTPEFLEKNSFGQVPVLQDGEAIVSDSNAILVYLALRYDTTNRWFPRGPIPEAQVQRWLSVAAGQLAYGPSTARLIKRFGYPYDYNRAVELSQRVFSWMEEHLSGRRFFVGESATIADIALYSYTALAPEGGLSLSAYPNINQWLSRIEALPGFVPMQRASL